MFHLQFVVTSRAMSVAVAGGWELMPCVFGQENPVEILPRCVPAAGRECIPDFTYIWSVEGLVAAAVDPF
jgi:hypothetical protein